MTPEAARYLDKARQCLADAVLYQPLVPRIAGREAYLAAFHAAEALNQRAHWQNHQDTSRPARAVRRACGVAGHPLDTKHPAIRETLRGIAREHGAPARRSAALTTAEVKRLSRACGTDLAGARDRALFLLGFALDLEHVTWTRTGMKLLIERSKTDAKAKAPRSRSLAGARPRPAR